MDDLIRREDAARDLKRLFWRYIDRGIIDLDVLDVSADVQRVIDRVRSAEVQDAKQ